MTYFAHITNGVVDKVIVIEQVMLNIGAWGNPSEWIETSIDTVEGKNTHGNTIRKNYAGVGYVYDSVRDAFIPPKPYASFILDKNKGTYVAPIAKPNNGNEYIWDEAIVNWKLK